MKKPTVRIENWAVVSGRLTGIVEGHPRFFDGSPLTTSEIVTNGAPNYIETRNTVYLLGEPAKPAEPPLTGIQNQAVAVAKKALIDEFLAAARAVNLELPGEFKAIAEESMKGSAEVAVRALIKARLLVQ